MTTSLTPINPFGSVLEGLRLGATISDIENVRQQRALAEMERARIEQERARVEQQRQQIQASTDKLFSLNPADRMTSADLGRLALVLPKDQFAQLEGVLKAQSEEQQTRSFALPLQAYAAYLQNDKQAVDNLLDFQIRAYRESNQPNQAQALQSIREAFNVNPNIGISLLTSPLTVVKRGQDLLAETEKRVKAPIELREAEAKLESAIKKAEQDGIDAKYAESIAMAKLTKEQQEALVAASNARFADRLNQLKIDQSTWDINNLRSQINTRAQQLGLDRQNILSQVAERVAKIAELTQGIPEGARKPINDAFVQGAAANQQQDQYNSLASRITNIGTSWGSLSSFSEWLKKSTGSQDAVSELRQEYTRLRNNAGIQALPPGPATDRDIALALSGFPVETGNPQVIASFLRGVAKMKGIEAATENAKAEWLSNNRGLLGRANRTFIAGDYTVQPGETFADLTKRIAIDVNQRYLSPEQKREQATQARIGQIPTTVPGQAPAPQVGPQPGVMDVMNLADQIIRGQR